MLNGNWIGVMLDGCNMYFYWLSYILSLVVLFRHTPHSLQLVTVVTVRGDHCTMYKEVSIDYKI
jgi:hypothetical protein